MGNAQQICFSFRNNFIPAVKIIPYFEKNLNGDAYKKRKEKSLETHFQNQCEHFSKHFLVLVVFPSLSLCLSFLFLSLYV